MKKFLKIDEQGYYIEPVVLEPIIKNEDLEIYFLEDYIEHILEEDMPENLDEFIKDYNLPKANCKTPKERMIETPFTDGMYKPRWTGSEWIDEITQEELDAMKPEHSEEPVTLEALHQKLEEQEEVNQMLAQQIVDLELQQLLGGIS